MAPKTILVTGGAGYVGSHIAVELLEHGYNVLVVDNLSNASATALKRVEKITGKSVEFVNVDMAGDQAALDALFVSHKIAAVIHCAGLKAVGESVRLPLLYYRNNLQATFNLLDAMKNHGCTKFIFSSSATVYGTPEHVPLTETSPVGAGITNPYGQTKFMIEQIALDVAKANPEWRVVILRYFNPVGAHPSGLIGENPRGVPNNLMPFIQQVAIGRRECLSVFGTDYDTPDGTGVRDYIHVVDLAKGHVAALDKAVFPDTEAAAEAPTGSVIYNLGSGTGISVLEMLAAFSKAVGRDLPSKMCPRREGDIATLYGDSGKAQRELGWVAELGLDRMCEDSWRFQSENPNGYEGDAAAASSSK